MQRHILTKIIICIRMQQKCTISIENTHIAKTVEC